MDLADAIRALAILKPRTEKERTAIIGCLGFRTPGGGAGANRKRAKFAGPALPKVPLVDRHHEGLGAPQPIQLRPLGRTPRRDGRTAQVAIEVRPLEILDEASLPPRPFSPLLDSNRSRALLSVLARVERPGAADLDALVEIMASFRPLLALPHRTEDVAIGIEVLVDVSENMSVFARDQRRIVSDLRRAIGRQRVRVYNFVEPPIGGVVTAFLTSRQVKPMLSGCDVLILSDLGIGGCVGPFVTGTIGRWRAFVAAASNASTKISALVPYPRHRWPPALVDMMTVVQWNETMSVRSVKAAIYRSRGRAQ